MQKANFGNYEFNTRKAQNDSQVSLWDLIERYKSGRLVVAPHQRSFVWEPEKVKEWARTIIEASKGDFAERPTGFMVTYQVPDDDAIYLNDGLQRLTASIKFLEDCTKYKLTAEQAAQLLINFDMPVQHRHYRSQERAMIQFQRINFGTPLTNAEFCAGFLGLLENSDTNWQPTIVELHAFVSTNLTEFFLSGPSLKAEALSLFSRHDYVLFYLYLSKSKSLKDFASLGVTNIKLDDADNGRTIEQVLRKELDNLGIDKVLDEFVRFKTYIKGEILTIKEIWDSFPHQSHHRLSHGLVRYLLTIALWAKNNGAPANLWKQFLVRLLPRTYLGAAVTYYKLDDPDHEHPHRATMSIAKINGIGNISKAIGSTFYDDVLGRIHIMQIGLPKAG